MVLTQELTVCQASQRTINTKLVFPKNSKIWSNEKLIEWFFGKPKNPLQENFYNQFNCIIKKIIQLRQNLPGDYVSLSHLLMQIKVENPNVQKTIFILWTELNFAPNSEQVIEKPTFISMANAIAAFIIEREKIFS